MNKRRGVTIILPFLTIEAFLDSNMMHIWDTLVPSIGFKHDAYLRQDTLVPSIGFKHDAYMNETPLNQELDSNLMHGNDNDIQYNPITAM